jgi:hypothetical protein
LQQTTNISSTFSEYCIGDYGFAFNGQEKDQEIYNNQSTTTATFWEYDGRIGRRWNVDPVVKEWESSYTCLNSNPIFNIDPNGDNTSTHIDKKGNVLAVYDDGDLGIYQHKDLSKETFKENTSKKLSKKQSEKVGRTMYIGSFLDGSGKASGYIDIGSFDARKTIWDFEGEMSKNSILFGNIQARLAYALNAGNNDKYDFKSKKGGSRNTVDIYRGSQISEGVYISIRDAGNFCAGMAARLTDQSKLDFMLTAGAFNLAKNNKIAVLSNLPAWKFMAKREGWPSYGEAERSNFFQRAGYENVRTPFDWGGKIWNQVYSDKKSRAW